MSIIGADPGVNKSITGMGIFLPNAHTVVDFHNNLSNNVSSIRQHENIVASLFTEDNFENYIDEYSDILADGQKNKILRILRRAPRIVAPAIFAAIQAYYQSNLLQRSIDKNRIAVIIAGSNLNNLAQFQCYNDYLTSNEEITPSPSYAVNFLDSNYGGIITELLGLSGPMFTIGGASASGSAAVYQACGLLEAGMIDAALVVAPVIELSVIEYIAFNQIGALVLSSDKFAADKLCRPFDHDRCGFVYGQGAASIVLERSDSGLIKILGLGYYCDGSREPDPSVAGEVVAMQQAIDMAKLKSEDINYINAHATSSIKGDITELTAINKIFNNSESSPVINGLKAYIGHCLSSASLVELIAVVNQLSNKIIYPSMNCQQPLEQCAKILKDGKILSDMKLDYALKNSFGFGGINTSILLKR